MFVFHWFFPIWLLSSLSSTTTHVAMASVAPPPPNNDLCIHATTVGVNSTTLGSTVHATMPDVSEFPLCGVTTLPLSARAVWYSAMGNGMRLRVSTCNAATNFDTLLAVFNGGCRNETSIDAARGCLDYNDDATDCGSASELEWDSDNGVQYHILIGSSIQSSHVGTFNLTVTDTGVASPPKQPIHFTPPTPSPTETSTASPAPTSSPTGNPASTPTESPTGTPGAPTGSPTRAPTSSASGTPTSSPTSSASAAPSMPLPTTDAPSTGPPSSLVTNTSSFLTAIKDASTNPANRSIILVDPTAIIDFDDDDGPGAAGRGLNNRYFDAICLGYDETTICTVKRSDGGGRLWLGKRSFDVSFEGFEFTDAMHVSNSSVNSRYGGAFAIFCEESPCVVKFVACAFRRNSARRRGGAIYLQSDVAPAQVSCTGCIFESNNVTEDYESGGGGAIYAYASDSTAEVHLNIVQTNFSDNVAKNGRGHDIRGQTWNRDDQFILSCSETTTSGGLSDVEVPDFRGAQQSCSDTAVPSAAPSHSTQPSSIPSASALPSSIPSAQPASAAPSMPLPTEPITPMPTMQETSAASSLSLPPIRLPMTSAASLLACGSVVALLTCAT